MATSDELRAALRDNRQGRIWAQPPYVEAARTLLSERMLVIEERPQPDMPADAIEFFGYAPEFDVLELGQSAPLYIAVVQAIAGEPAKIIGFQREAERGSALV